MSGSRGQGPVFGGLRLEQHAGISAALADGIPLSQVAMQEGVDEARWPEADRAWMLALADSPDLQMAYMQKRRQAEDALGRSIAPLDDDPMAWAGLLSALSAADDPAKVLEPLGLRMTDVGRLGRKWKRKAEEDPKVVETLTAAASTASPPQRVDAAPVALKPFPWSPGYVAPAAATPSSAPTASAPAAAGDLPSIDLARLSRPHGGRLPIETDPDLFAAMVALGQVVPDELQVALALCGLDEARFGGVEEAWEARMATDPDVRASLTLRIADHRDALRHLLAGAEPVVHRP